MIFAVMAWIFIFIIIPRLIKYIQSKQSPKSPELKNKKSILKQLDKLENKAESLNTNKFYFRLDEIIKKFLLQIWINNLDAETINMVKDFLVEFGHFSNYLADILFSKIIEKAKNIPNNPKIQKTYKELLEFRFFCVYSCKGHRIHYKMKEYLYFIFYQKTIWIWQIVLSKWIRLWII